VAKNSLLSGQESETPKLYEPVKFDSGPDRYGGRPHELTSKEKLAKIESAAFDKGYADGLHAVGAAAKRLDAVITGIDDFRNKKTIELLPDIVELAADIATKIIHVSIEKDREIIVSVVREAIRKLGGWEEKLMIRVNPADYDIMLTNLEVLREESRLRDITIEPSASISPGGCYIETPSGEVDARIEEQLKEIRDAIATAINS
jgi:flagellar biosynthesis/type III secretory pathway protein FliH